MVKAREKLDTEKWPELIMELKPDWLVLRVREETAIKMTNPDLLTKNYKLTKHFNVTPEIINRTWLPGKNYLYYDAKYVIYKKTDLSKNGTPKNI
jgi:hypothetical protein